MGKSPSHKTTRLKAKPHKVSVNCRRQFPDCPETPNDGHYKTCPHYKK